MKLTRDVSSLSDRPFDLLVVGGGIHGACVARDAAMRGLSVALIERGDFGSGTSHNSLKLIHGGIRYLQHLDLRRVKQSIDERRFWLSCAPHLTRPLRFVIPAVGYGMRGVFALGAATQLYELLSAGCNRGIPAANRVPRGGVLSRGRLLADLPGLKRERLSGAAYWHDAQMIDPDRILLECLQSAAAAGAVVCNYVRADGFLRSGARVAGVEASDAESGKELEIRASLTVNTAGPWANELVAPLFGRASSRLASLSKCMNLVVRGLDRLALPEYAFGVVSPHRSDSVLDSSERMFFVTPWQGLRIIGTSHLPYRGDPDELVFSGDDVEAFLDEINAAYPFELEPSDVVYCYGGLTPAEEGQEREQVKRARHGDVVDHASEHGVDGIVTLIGVKYTTARLAAEEAVDLAFAKLERASPPCRTRVEALPGARPESGAPPPIDVTAWDTDDAAGLRFLMKRIRDAVRDEMVVRLADVLYRRTNIVECGRATPRVVDACADTVATELGWPPERRDREARDIAPALSNTTEAVPGEPGTASNH